MSCLRQIDGINIPDLLDRIDGYLNREEYEEARKLIDFWTEEARSLGDIDGELAMLNERIGLARRLEDEDWGIEGVEDCLILTGSGRINSELTIATTYINAATTRKAFNMVQDAMPLYRKAQEIYERILEPDDPRLAGLYNNMSLALMDMDLPQEAERLQREAIRIMHKNGGYLEEAISYANLADFYYASEKQNSKEGEKSRNLMERPRACMETALLLMEIQEIPRDGSYAFACRKLAPAFEFYGFTEIAQILDEFADSIYEGNRNRD